MGAGRLQFGTCGARSWMEQPRPGVSPCPGRGSAGSPWGTVTARHGPKKGRGTPGEAPAPSSALLSPCVLQMPSTCHRGRR